ncbi:MAG TPA: resolvase, partial [Chloroflexota bacterium]|nr:resolvase [Chloroflexota bacterium]
FLAVEPEHRLVARSLEREWNAKLADVERLEREDAARPSSTARLVTPEERQRILALAQDLPTVWQAPTTTHLERKQVLRCLIKDVTLTRQAATIHVAIRWQTEACTTLEVPRPPRSADLRRTDPAVIRRIDELAPSHTDRQIAARLNDEGRAPGLKGTFTADKVQWLRYKHRIPSGCPEGPLACPTGQRGDGRYSARAAAAELNVSVSTIAAWCQEGRLDGIQTAPHGPWWVRLTPAVVTALRKSARRRWARRASPDQGVS